MRDTIIPGPILVSQSFFHQQHLKLQTCHHKLPAIQIQIKQLANLFFQPDIYYMTCNAEDCMNRIGIERLL